MIVHHGRFHVVALEYTCLLQTILRVLSFYRSFDFGKLDHLASEEVIVHPVKVSDLLHGLRDV